MKREWKPGDVAIVDGPGTRLPITFFRNEERGELMFNNGCGYRHPVRRLASAARPLAVIDPEDREQVERLLGYYVAPFDDFVTDGRTDHMQAALREFANPKPPKPDEPQGLGAVVEDIEGVLWIRADTDGMPWMNSKSSGDYWQSYADITAVRVLSEGWSE